MSEPSSPDEAWRELAARLKALRADAGMTGPAFAKEAKWSQSKVSRVENKVTRPSGEDVARWAELTNAPRDVADELERLAEVVSTATRSWRAVHAKGLAFGQREIAEIEARAVSVRNYQTQVIPGLLQVPAYAEQIFRMVDQSPIHDIPEAVAARMNRQAILYTPGKSFIFVIHETALGFRPRFADVRQVQAVRLLTVESLPNVTLVVVPRDIPQPILPPPFTLFDVPSEPLVLLEGAEGHQFLSAESDVLRYEARLKAVLSVSAADADARSLIRSAAAL